MLYGCIWILLWIRLTSVGLASSRARLPALEWLKLQILYSLTEARSHKKYFHHEETRLRKAYAVACEGHEESHQTYFPLASCSVETNPFEKEVLSSKLDKEKSLLSIPSLSQSILLSSRERGNITIRHIVSITGVSRNTIKAHVQNLVREKLLFREGKGKGAWYHS